MVTIDVGSHRHTAYMKRLRVTARWILIQQVLYPPELRAFFVTATTSIERKTVRSPRSARVDRYAVSVTGSAPGFYGAGS